MVGRESALRDQSQTGDLPPHSIDSSSGPLAASNGMDLAEFPGTSPRILDANPVLPHSLRFAVLRAARGLGPGARFAVSNPQNSRSIRD